MKSKAKIIPIDQKKKRINVAVSIVAAMFLVALYCTIFNFSEQNGQESGNLSHKVTRAIVDEVDHVAKKNWTDAMKEMIVASWEHPVRKLAHFSEYAVMGILLFLIWYAWINKRWKLILLVIGWVFLSAALDEYHQSFVADRCGNIIDVLIDTSGGCFGLLLSMTIKRIWGFLHGRKGKGN